MDVCFVGLKLPPLEKTGALTSKLAFSVFLEMHLCCGLLDRWADRSFEVFSSFAQYRCLWLRLSQFRACVIMLWAAMGVLLFKPMIRLKSYVREIYEFSTYAWLCVYNRLNVSRIVIHG